ncbi:MAG: LPS-assembly protein LptD [Candidatus Omnitrophica bacterium]|nr:LPS-assembly protein LptD [Candidatus Omnitrophota bacterium]
MNLFKKIVSCALLLLIVIAPSSLAEDKKTPPPAPREFALKKLFETQKYDVEAVADSIEYSRDMKKVIAKGNVVLTYRDTKLTSDYAEIETETKVAYARGHVIVFRNEEPTAHGNEIEYDFEHESGKFPDGRLLATPWFAKGEDIQQIRKGLAVVNQGSITTCDRERPHYDIRAKKVTIYSGDKMIARNVTIYALGKPIFWWPYMVIPLKQNHYPISVTAGYNSRFGGFVEVSKGIAINKNISGEIQADWRARRGVGGGAELDYDYGIWATGVMKAYITQDKRAPKPRAEHPFDELENRERGMISWRHRTDLDPYSNIQLRYNRLADEYFLQEFFQHEHRAEVEPQSFVTLTKNSEHYGFLAHFEKKMNTFESLVERLPEFRFDWKNQPFFNPRIFYDSQTSFANLNKRFSRSDYNEDVVRTDSFHEWSAPMKWKEIKFTPYINGRGTYYSREKESDQDQFRAILGMGADLRTQFYKTIPVTWRRAGIEINHLRHVMEPSVQFQHLNSSVSDETLSRFDSIDRLDDANIVTFGLENRFQTKRVVAGKMRRVDFVSLNTFLNYEMHPDGRTRVGLFEPFEEPGRTSSNFTILSQEIVLRPYEWLQYELRTDYDMERDAFRILNQDLLMKVRRLKIIFGHRYTNSIGELQGSSQFVFDGRWVINPLWTVGGYLRWDSETQDLQEWQLSATRDLHDFLFDFGYNVRNSDISNSNKTLFFNLRMKAFPFIHIRGGGNYSSFGEPRIGDTIAGANQSPISQQRPETYEFGSA